MCPGQTHGASDRFGMNVTSLQLPVSTTRSDLSRGRYDVTSGRVVKFPRLCSGSRISVNSLGGSGSCQTDLWQTKTPCSPSLLVNWAETVRAEGRGGGKKVNKAGTVSPPRWPSEWAPISGHTDCELWPRWQTLWLMSPLVYKPSIPWSRKGKRFNGNCLKLRLVPPPCALSLYRPLCVSIRPAALRSFTGYCLGLESKRRAYYCLLLRTRTTEKGKTSSESEFLN